MNKIIKSVILGMAGMHAIALGAETRPKLVVGIIVDQLRTDYLEYLQNQFGQGGFVKLMNQGAFIKDVDFKIPAPDVASATAILQTGSYPRQNGIAAASIFNPAEKKEIPVFQDGTFIGNFTTETFSPAALRVTTLSDEIAVAGDGSSQIHSISPDAAQAIILTGHAGNSAFWLNDNTGKWSTTTYYPATPSTVRSRNYTVPLISRIDTMKWTPKFRTEKYLDIPFKQLRDGFKYTFPRTDRDVYELFKLTPLINSEVTEIAEGYLKELSLGKKLDAIDVLNIGYTLAPYPISKGDGKFELEDAYLRLDQDIEELLKAIEQYVGLNNTLIYVASTGYVTEAPRDTKAFKLPGGTFSVKRALSLLNSYLSARYGNGSYVEQYSNNHIYLDHSAIEEKNLDLNKISEESRDFLVKVSGVADAYTISDLMSPSVPQLEGHRLANDPKTAGDIVIEFNADWQVIDDTRFPTQEQVRKSTIYTTPVLIMGGNIKPQIINTPVDAASIAPTIAKALRIRAPSSTMEKPIL